MTFRELAVWCLMSVAIPAIGQVENEESFFTNIRTTLEKAIPEIDGLAHSERAIEYTYAPDTKPFSCYFRFPFATGDGKYGDLLVYINPQDEAIGFDVTKDFEVLDIEGTCHGIRGDQRFEQAATSNKYTGPFTALFLGHFTLPYNTRYPHREGGCWGPQQFITTTTYTAYDISKHYLDVQGIYILIQGDQAFADKLIKKIDFAALNALIVK